MRGGWINSERAGWLWKPLLAAYIGLYLWNNPWVVTQYYPGPMFGDKSANMFAHTRWENLGTK